MPRKLFMGKVALVTGGSRGIGTGIVRRFAADGASVAFTCSSSEEKALNLVRQIDSAGGKLLALKANSASAEELRAAVGFSPSQVPRAASAARRVASQSRTNSQFQQCGSATARCFPLPPQGCTQAQPDPTSQVNQHIGRFTETEIAAPAPEIGGQFRDCRFHADAFAPSRGFPGQSQ
jgi:hypothetical protein